MSDLSSQLSGTRSHFLFILFSITASQPLLSLFLVQAFGNLHKMFSHQIVLGCALFAHQALALPIYPYITRAAAASNSSVGNFGSCTVPQIQFATGFDNRKETSFEPVDQGKSTMFLSLNRALKSGALVSYNHGSAQNIDIITQFMCDTLVNSCGADQTAQATCATAKTAADAQTAKTGAQADGQWTF